MKETRLQTLPDDLNLNILLFLTFSELITFRRTSNEIKNWDLSKILSSVTIKFSPTVPDHMVLFLRLSVYRAKLTWEMKTKSIPCSYSNQFSSPFPLYP